MKIALALLCLLAPHALHAAEPVRAFGGARTVVNVSHMQPAMRDGEGYGEKYTFNADFGERGSLYYSLTISNLGMGDHKMDARGRLTLDGETFKWKKNLDDDEWSFSKGKLGIKAGPARLEGDPKKLVFKVDKGDNSFEAIFTPVARPWRPRGGQVRFGKEQQIADFTVFPLEKVTLKGKIGGKDVTAEGFGFGSHSWSDIPPYEQARSTLDLRGISGEDTIYIREIATPAEFGRARVAYLIVTRGDKLVVESIGDFQLKITDTFVDRKHDNRYRVPEGFQFMGKDSEEGHRMVRGKITKKKLRKREDLLKNMNAALRMVASQYSQPVRYDYDVDFVVETRVGEDTHRFEGVGRYEVVHWNAD